MNKTVLRWHQRYLHQVRWTRSIANYIFQQAHIMPDHRILEVGCGTGAVLQEIIEPKRLRSFGLDINPDYLLFTAKSQSHDRLILGDAHDLPFANQSFDVCICHFLLLWVANPEAVIHEMVRTTRSGGWVISLAEPDYEGRIDYPQELTILGKWQMESLRQQGADPLLGRKLRSIFSRSGLLNVEAGVLGGEWKSTFRVDELENEWTTLQSDLVNDPEKTSLLDHYSTIDSHAWRSGERILFVPTFYAWGQVP